MKTRIWLFLIALLIQAPSAIATVNCWATAGIDMNFGSVRYTAPTSTAARISYACYGGYASPQQVYHIRFCTFVNADPALFGIMPRELRHWDNSRMKYDLYSDAAHAQIIGAPGSPFPVASWQMDLLSNEQKPGEFALYGKVPPAQGGLSVGTYESHFSGGILRWRWSRGPEAVPSEAQCKANSGGEGGGEVGYFLNVTANAQDACFIRMAADLDFGTQTDLTMMHDRQTAIVVQCPLNTAWTLSLSPGLHASGAARHMQNAYGDTITYGLYQDVAHLQPWGLASVSGLGSGMGAPISVPVYGRVPSQKVVGPGVYTDSVTVTLTY